MTPPIVGSVSTEMNIPLASRRLKRAALVLAICMRENMPSCILAPPPEPEMITRGSLLSRARAAALVIFSPTTEPILPMMKLESVAPNTIFLLWMVPVPTRAASFRPVRFCSV